MKCSRFEAVMATDLEDARSRAFYLIAEGTKTEAGCIETPTLDARKVRFKGRQMAAYRFVFCILNGVSAGYDDVVRRSCNNRRWINPDHLGPGSRGGEPSG